MANDHYVSCSYLRRFLHPSTVETGVPLLYPYSRNDGEMRPRGVKVLGCAEDFYRIRSQTGRSDRIVDETLTFMENELFRNQEGRQSAFHRLASNRTWPLSSVEKLEVASVIAMMRCRAPVQIHNVAMLAHAANNIDAFNALNKEDFKRELLSDGMTEKELVEGREAFVRGDVYVAVEKGMEKQVGLESLEYIPTLASILHGMRWRLIVGRESECFITSDNPVVIDVPNQPNGQGIVQSPLTELWFPVSYNLGILADHRSGPDFSEVPGHSQARVLNRRIVKWCYRYVYAPQPLDWLELAIRTTRFNPLLRGLASLQSLFDSAEGDVVDITKHLTTDLAEKTDIFRQHKMR